MANILRNAVFTPPPPLNCMNTGNLNWLIYDVLLIYKIFWGTHTFMHTQLYFCCWIILKEMIVLDRAKHTAAIFLLQTRKQSLSTPKCRKHCANTHTQIHIVCSHKQQKKSLWHHLWMKIHTHSLTHTRAHMSWLWVLIWDHDKHAADGACRERGRVAVRDTETESHIKSFPCHRIYPSALWTRLA